MTTPTSNPLRLQNALFLIAFVLISPALFAGFMGDDYLHIALMKPGLPVTLPTDASIYGLFSFMDADPVRNKELMDLGLLPWWTYPEMKYAFWRPISELTHGLDHLLWEGNAPLMHLHSMLWYLGVCYLVLKLFKRVYPTLPNKLLLAGFSLYLLDASHGFTLAWIANRNGLIAATFGVASIYTYVQSRQNNSTPLFLLSLIFLALALLSAELGISTIGYLGAYGLFLDKKGWFKGGLMPLPHIIIVAIWWITYKSLGFGAENADAYYLDPIASPLTFLGTLAQRLLVLFGSQWGLVPAEIYGFSDANQEVANLVFSIALVICLITLMAIFKQLTRSATARFWFFGSLFSALPVCAALPHDRLLLFIGIGAVGVIIDLLFQGYSNCQREEPKTVKLTGGHSKPIRVFLFYFFFLHLVISPLALPLLSYSPKVWASQIDSAPMNFDDIAQLQTKKLVLFNVPIGSSMALAVWRFNENLDMPESIWPISNSASNIKLTRLSDNELLIEKEGGFVQKEETSVRNISTQPFSIGESITMSGLTIKIIETAGSRPTVIKATFTKSLNSDDLIFLSWDNILRKYQTIAIPGLGASAFIEVTAK